MMTRKPEDSLAITARELISQRIGQCESYQDWLERLRRENAEQRAEQLCVCGHGFSAHPMHQGSEFCTLCVCAGFRQAESAADRDTRHRMDAYYGCDDSE